MVKICKNCGKEYKGQNIYFCNMECASEYRQHYSVCPVCGKKFKKSPSDQNYTCGKRECKKIFRSEKCSDVSRKTIQKALAVIPINPNTGKFDTNMKAKTWILRDPKGKVYEVNNLLKWCRDQESIAFDGEYLTFYKGIQDIKRTIQGKKKRGSYQYKGWTLNSFYEENLLIKNTTSH